MYKNAKGKKRKMLSHKLGRLRRMLREETGRDKKQRVHADIVVIVQALSDMGVKETVPEITYSGTDLTCHIGV